MTTRALILKVTIFWAATPRSSVKSIDVSEERTAPFFRVHEYAKQVASNKQVALMLCNNKERHAIISYAGYINGKSLLNTRTCTVKRL
jgi:hypothetical protein